MAIARPWEAQPEWRQVAFDVTSAATACAMCGLAATSYRAMPRNTDRPFDDLVAVCGYCSPQAGSYRVLPDHIVGPLATHAWVRDEQAVNDPLRKKRPENPLRPVDERKRAFLDLREDILGRDNEVCQYCGQHGNRVDKINGFRPFADRENWVCVCVRCSAAAAGLSAPTLRQKRMMVLEARGVEPVTSVITKGHVPLKQRLKQRRRG